MASTKSNSNGQESASELSVNLVGDAGPRSNVRKHLYYPHRNQGQFSRWQYLKTTFDISMWNREALSQLGSTVSGLYATLLVVIYMAFSFTELVKFPLLKEYLEIKGFFVYLYIVSNLYFVYVLGFVIWRSGRDDPERPLVVENDKSHGSLTIRYGAIIFGLGTFIYFLIELLTFFENPIGSPCYHGALGANNFLALTFVFLQAYIIFMYPRLNLHCHPFFNRLGTMHIVATNIIIWIRTLIKESMEEIEEYEVEEVAEGEDPDGKCDFLLERMKIMEEMKHECKKYSNDFLRDDILTKSSPYLYPFIIEFALIGASVLLIMSNHIGRVPEGDEVEINRVHKPHPIRCIKKSDLAHTMKGMVAGLIVIGIAISNLSIFFGLDGHEATEDHAEYVSKISNTIINLVGIGALIVGIAELQHLEPRETSDEGFDLDMALLRFTSFFSFMYMIFTVITGAFNDHVNDFPNELHLINGVVDLTQVFLQICFIQNLKNKVPTQDHQAVMPGRQVTIFLFLFNLAQWIVFTFEIQKVRASPVEEDFYGFMSWVIIQRVTLPLAVFFRFHSAVVSIEQWKEVYVKHNHTPDCVTMSGQGAKTIGQNPPPPPPPSKIRQHQEISI